MSRSGSISLIDVDAIPMVNVQEKHPIWPKFRKNKLASQTSLRTCAALCRIKKSSLSSIKCSRNQELAENANQLVT